jgi:hypothetical protein
MLLQGLSASPFTGWQIIIGDASALFGEQQVQCQQAGRAASAFSRRASVPNAWNWRLADDDA